MTRIAYLISCYPKLSEAFILREVHELRARGFDIRVASINDPDQPNDRQTHAEQAEASSTYYVKRHGLRGALRAHLTTLATRPIRYIGGLFHALRLGPTNPTGIVANLCYFVEAIMIGRWMNAAGLSHLHVHFATPASTVGLLARRVFPITFSLTVHGPDEFYEVSRHHLREKITAASFVCCIGHYARSQLMKLSSPEHWEKLEIAPLGVDPAVFTPAAAPAEAKGFEVLCVGRLVPAKGQHVLVAALHRLVQAGREVRLRLVGDGPDRAALESSVAHLGISDHVVFEGGVNQDRIRKLYRRADAFALASFAEGIPVVLMEAMAMEIPCVTTFITGIPELIRDGVDGILVPPSDEEALAVALARLMDHPALGRELGRAGRQRVADRYHLSDNIDRLAELFRRRLDSPTEQVKESEAEILSATDRPGSTRVLVEA